MARSPPRRFDASEVVEVSSRPVIPPAAERFLRTHTRAFLVTRRPDGAPACHPMVGLWHDGALYMNTYRKSAKMRNIAHEPRVACVVLTADDDPAFAAVVLRGRAELVSTLPRPDAPAAPVGEDVVRRVQTRLADGKRVVVRVVPEEVRVVGDHA
jgi:PPOX class probable F420-dependent enzyme